MWVYTFLVSIALAASGAMCGCKACHAPVDAAQPSTCLPCSQYHLQQLLRAVAQQVHLQAGSQMLQAEHVMVPPVLSSLTGLPLLPAAKCILKWAVQRENCWCPQCKAPFQYLFTYRNLDGTLNDFPQEESVVLLKRAEWFVATLKVSLGAQSTRPGLCWTTSQSRSPKVALGLLGPSLLCATFLAG